MFIKLYYSLVYTVLEYISLVENFQLDQIFFTDFCFFVF